MDVKKILNRESLFKNRRAVIIIIVGLLINFASWIYLAFNIRQQSDLIFLHYNIYFGVDLIGEWYRIYIMPLAGIAIYFINVYLSFILYKREKVLSYMLIGITIFLQIIIFVESYLITVQNV